MSLTSSENATPEDRFCPSKKDVRETTRDGKPFSLSLSPSLSANAEHGGRIYRGVQFLLRPHLPSWRKRTHTPLSSVDARKKKMAQSRSLHRLKPVCADALLPRTHAPLRHLRCMRPKTLLVALVADTLLLGLLPTGTT